MNKKNQPQKKRHPRKIENPGDGWAAHEATDEFQVAHRLYARIEPCTAPNRACAQSKTKRLFAYLSIKPQSRARQQPRTQKIIEPQKCIEQDEDTEETDKRGDRAG